MGFAQQDEEKEKKRKRLGKGEAVRARRIPGTHGQVF
jgi:hypothetical protein